MTGTRSFLGLGFALLVGWAGAPGGAGAQDVVGELLDRASGQGIDGVFVMALDAGGAAVAGALTDEEGAFRIALPGPGTYTLSAQRIGYRTTASPPLDVAAGQLIRHRMEVDTEPVALADLNVSAERRCTMVEGAGATLVRLWEEARKAMLVAEWTRETGAIEMQIEDFQRTLDPYSLEVLSESRSARGYYGARPYLSLPAEVLAAGGYVVQRSDGTYYFAPDESVLLSDSFLETHCFTPRRDPNKPGLIGLAFEPIRDVLRPDIRGAFWLDQESAELRYVEFRYSQLLERVSAPEAGGRVEFRRLEGGAWVVDRWYIRMPQLAYQAGGGSRVRLNGRVYRSDTERHRMAGGDPLRVLNYVDEGGRVLRTVDAAEARARNRGVVEGRVLDRTTGQGLEGAVVFLSGTQYRTVTDAEGRYRLNDLPVDTFPLVYRHERLRELGTFARPVEVALIAGQVVRVDLFFPPEGGGS